MLFLHTQTHTARASYAAISCSSSSLQLPLSRSGLAYRSACCTEEIEQEKKSKCGFHVETTCMYFQSSAVSESRGEECAAHFKIQKALPFPSQSQASPYGAYVPLKMSALFPASLDLNGFCLHSLMFKMQRKSKMCLRHVFLLLWLKINIFVLLRSSPGYSSGVTSVLTNQTPALYKSVLPVFCLHFLGMLWHKNINVAAANLKSSGKKQYFTVVFNESRRKF